MKGKAKAAPGEKDLKNNDGFCQKEDHKKNPVKPIRNAPELYKTKGRLYFSGRIFDGKPIG